MAAAPSCRSKPGGTTGEDIQTALSLTGKGGRVVVTGMGNYAPGRRPRDPLSLYEQGLIKLDELVTTRHALEDINEGYQDMRDGNNIRGMVVYTDADR
jgi:Zn-dependent alcohol dehydrogenase